MRRRARICASMIAPITWDCSVAERVGCGNGDRQLSVCATWLHKDRSLLKKWLALSHVTNASCDGDEYLSAQGTSPHRSQIEAM